MAHNEADDSEIKPFECYKETVEVSTYHVYISTVIGEPSEYTKLINLIRSAGQHDKIYIHLNTPGGDLTTGVQIISAMQNSPAHIVTCIEGEVASLGTLIFLAADEFVVNDNCLMMIHNYSGGIYGKGHEQIAQLTAVTKWFNELAQKYYKHFLTAKELKSVEGGEDLWLMASDIRKRLNRLVNRLEKEK